MATPVVLNGQVGLSPSRQQLAAQGSYFNITNPTFGTGVAYALKTATSATANGLFSISNNNPTGGKTIYPDYLKLIETATIPTGTLVMRFEAQSETGIVALSGTAAAVTPVNVNAAFANTTGAVVTAFSAGAGTVPAAVGTRRNLGWASIQGAGALWDEYVLSFGGEDPGASGGGTAAKAAAGRVVTRMIPLAIPPQTSLILNMYWITAAANTPSFEYELPYYEL